MELQRKIETGLLHLFHEEGVESFSIASAAYNICKEADRTFLVVSVRCRRATVIIQELEDLFHAEPWFEVIVDLADAEADLHEGAILYLSPGYDYVRDEHITNFYYASHMSIEELKIEVLRFDESSARLRIDGLTGAAHGDADTLFAIDSEFARDTNLKRSIR